MIEITPILAFNDNYIWMIANPTSQQVWIVDPGQAAPVIAALEKKHYSPTGILVTHHHFDHTGGIEQLVKQYDCPVYGPTNDPITICSHRLTEQDTLSFPDTDLHFSVLDIPGHTKGHIAFFGGGLLFCGDTLFTGGCGRLFEGTPAEMVQSLTKLSQLPPNTRVYCGHEYTLANLAFAKIIEPDNFDIEQRIHDTKKLRAQNLPTVPSTIKIELATNPFLRCDQPVVIQAAEKYAQKKLNTTIDVFATIRQWKNQI